METSRAGDVKAQSHAVGEWIWRTSASVSMNSEQWQSLEGSDNCCSLNSISYLLYSFRQQILVSKLSSAWRGTANKVSFSKKRP